VASPVPVALHAPCVSVEHFPLCPLVSVTAVLLSLDTVKHLVWESVKQFLYWVISWSRWENELSVVVCTCDPRAREAEAGGLRVPDQPELHRKTLFQKRKRMKL
jgi:hypothetical protein